MRRIGLLDHVPVVGQAGHAAVEPEADWLTGTGVAAAMIATIPPRGHVADASVTAETDGRFTVRVGTAEFGNGTTTVHTQIAATVLGVEPDRITVRQSDTMRWVASRPGDRAKVVGSASLKPPSTSLMAPPLCAKVRDGNKPGAAALAFTTSARRMPCGCADEKYTGWLAIRS